jgi:hypothetical protein
MKSAQDCRRHAAECTRLSKTAATPKLKSVFSSLSRKWCGVARQLDRLNEYEASRAKVGVLSPRMLRKRRLSALCSRQEMSLGRSIALA